MNAMKEEQNHFAYENMDNGSNHSLNRDGEGGGGGSGLGNLNMGQLVQNPGRNSEGGDHSNSQRKSAGRSANIFAAKVRKTVGKDSAEKSQNSPYNAA